MELLLNDSKFWDEKYLSGSDGWDLKSVNPVFASLFQKDTFKPKAPLLVIGCGKGYDSLFAASNGVETVGIDFANEAITFASENNFRERLNYLKEDFFTLGKNHKEEFQSVYEYTTFCAVKPKRIGELLENIYHSLQEEGRLYSVLFPIDGREGGPPFSIDLNNFLINAKKFFVIEFFSKIIPSVKPRRGKEVLLIFRKKRNAY